jgi:hypothetical protein
MSICYIAGPMTGIPGFNYRAFDEARDILRTHGWKVISPADLDRVNLNIDFSTMTGNEDLSPWRTRFARQDMEALLKVERLFVLEGWEQSTGARNEMTMAAMLGVPICTFPGHDPVVWEAHFSNAPQVADSEANRLLDAEFAGTTPTYSIPVGERSFYWVDVSKTLAEHDELVGNIQSTPDPYRAAALKNEAPYRTADERRVTDPETGGEKGTKLARYDLIPAGPLLQLAEHYGIGAAKYEPNNWRRGYAWSLSFAALQRHAWAFWNGEDNDPETQSHHMAAVAFHAFALIEFGGTDTGTDDRP